MFEFNPDYHYMMPAHFGPRPGGRGSAKYNDVVAINISYLTDRDLLASYLPKPFEPTEEAIVTVSYSMNREIEWLAGRSYNIVGVNASVVFNGEEDHLVGGFPLVLWENLTDPILTGRELTGIPKIFADIEDHTIIHGEWRTAAHNYGSKIVDIMIKDLKPVPEKELRQMEKASEGGNWMGWKYVQGTGDGPTVSHATLFPTSTLYKEASVGTGEVVWHELTWEQNPTQFHIVNALKALPILEYRSAMVARTESNLALQQRPIRMLK